MGDDDQTKLCTNCERQVPTANYTIHSVHCARNLKVCQKCKEPVPVSDMKKHLENVPCKQCGERMQACDVSPHQREACPQTNVTCCHCTLQLARALMRDHETYCGTRTERCDECGEQVMIKYRKLHEESNHGFLKLDDEPGPQPSWMSSHSSAELTSGITRPSASVYPAPKPSSVVKPKTAPQSSTRNIQNFPSSASSSRNITSARAESSTLVASASSTTNNSLSTDSRTNQNMRNTTNPTTSSAQNSFYLRDNIDQTLTDQNVSDINSRNASLLQKKLKNRPSSSDFQVPSSFVTSNAAQSSSSDNSVKDTNQVNGRASKGAMKKYPAPQPPNAKKQKDNNKKNENVPNAPSTSFKHVRDVPMYAATQREQNQIREREKQTEINLAQGLPPVLNPAQKLDKLKKMSALQNMELDRDLYNKQPAKNTKKNNGNDLNFTPMSEDELMKRLEKQKINIENKGASGNAVNLNRRNSKDKNVNVRNNSWRANASPAHDVNAGDDHYYEPIDGGLWDPPAANSAAVSRNTDAVNAWSAAQSRPQPVDRFSEIKNDLRVLRKELKECSSPLESRHSTDSNNSQQSGNSRNSDSSRVLRDQSAKTNAQRSRIERDSSSVQQNDAGGWGAAPPRNGSGNVTRNEKNQNRKDRKNNRQMIWNDSPGMKVHCQHCNKMIPQIELEDHEIYCLIRSQRREGEQRGSPDDRFRVDNFYSAPQQNQAMQPPRNMPADDFMDTPADLVGVMLPCEFCHQSIPAHMFVTHETGCNPVETSIRPPSTSRTPDREVNLLSNAAQAPIKNTNLQRSNSQRQQDNWVYNENSNKRNRRNNVSEETRLARNMRMYKERIGVPVANVIARDPRDEINAEGAFGYGEDDDDQLPCEFCSALLPADMLMLHQTQCEN